MRKTRDFHLSHAAFTLMELLVVIVILTVLSGMTFAVVVKVKQKAKETRCTNNLRQIGVAMGAYAADNNDNFPPNIEQESSDEMNETVWSAALVSRHYLPEPTHDNPFFLCPFDPAAADEYAEAYRSYAYNPGTADEMKEAIRGNVEGLATTILLAEWFEPDPYAPTAEHAVWDSEGWSIRTTGGLYKHHPGGTSGVLFYDLHAENVKACASLPSPETPVKWTFETK